MVYGMVWYGMGMMVLYCELNAVANSECKKKPPPQQTSNNRGNLSLDYTFT